MNYSRTKGLTTTLRTGMNTQCYPKGADVAHVTHREKLNLTYIGAAGGHLMLHLRGGDNNHWYIICNIDSPAYPIPISNIHVFPTCNIVCSPVLSYM